jgi:hypothetical protein
MSKMKVRKPIQPLETVRGPPATFLLASRP